jgi:hypothetical protein
MSPAARWWKSTTSIRDPILSTKVQVAASQVRNNNAPDLADRDEIAVEHPIRCVGRAHNLNRGAKVEASVEMEDSLLPAKFAVVARGETHGGNAIEAKRVSGVGRSRHDESEEGFDEQSRQTFRTSEDR